MEYTPRAFVTAVPVPPPEAVTVTPESGAAVRKSLTVPVTGAFDAATYGPTNGPPVPDGPEPTGTTGLVEVSVSARATLTRPLPVCAELPAGSALRASRPMMTAFEAAGSFALRSAAAPATIAAEADVPVIDVVPPPSASARTPTPGAPRNVSLP